MHELSIAMSLIDVITETLIRENADQALGVTVEVGALSGVVPEALQTAFVKAVSNTPLHNCRLSILYVPVSVRCSVCEQICQVPPDGLLCPNCGSSNIDIVRGRELDVIRIETS